MEWIIQRFSSSSPTFTTTKYDHDFLITVSCKECGARPSSYNTRRTTLRCKRITMASEHSCSTTRLSNQIGHYGCHSQTYRTCGPPMHGYNHRTPDMVTSFHVGAIAFGHRFDSSLNEHIHFIAASSMNCFSLLQLQTQMRIITFILDETLCGTFWITSINPRNHQNRPGTWFLSWE